MDTYGGDKRGRLNKKTRLHLDGVKGSTLIDSRSQYDCLSSYSRYSQLLRIDSSLTTLLASDQSSGVTYQ
jgi:hypothetical protein